MHRRPFIQLVATALVSRSRPEEVGTRPTPSGTSRIPITDAEHRLRLLLPAAWYLGPLTGNRLLEMSDERGSARIYLCSYEREPGDAEGIESYAAWYIDCLPACMDLRGKPSRRSLVVGGRPAVQYTVTARLHHGGELAYCPTFIDAPDRRDVIVGDAPRLEDVYTAVNDLLQDVAYASV